MKKLLVSGCSFSVSTRLNPHRLWIPWTDFLSDVYSNLEIFNVANSSFGQSKIVSSIVKSIEIDGYDPDFVVIQLSAISRGFSVNQNEFIDRLLKEDLNLIGSEEDLINEKIPEIVSSKIQKVDDIYHINSFVKIILLKEYLNSKNIPYLMFHGWQQFTADDTFSKIWKEKIYDSNFWRWQEFGGMNEYIIDMIGEERGLIYGNFHPTTLGHSIFLNDIILPILYEKNLIDSVKTIDKNKIF